MSYITSTFPSVFFLKPSTVFITLVTLAYVQFFCIFTFSVTVSDIFNELFVNIVLQKTKYYKVNAGGTSTLSVMCELGV